MHDKMQVDMRDKNGPDEQRSLRASKKKSKGWSCQKRGFSGKGIPLYIF